MTSLFTYILTLNFMKWMIIVVYGNEELYNYADSNDVDDSTLSHLYGFDETVVTEHSIEAIDIDVSLHESLIKVRLKSKKCYHVTLHAYFEDNFDVSQTFYEKQLNDICNDQINRMDELVNISVPDTLVYFDEQNLENPTNFYVSQLEVYVSFILPTGELYNDELKKLPLKNPWYRPPRPRYCQSWKLHLQNLLKWKYIPTSSLTFDPNLLSSIVAFSSKDIGVTRKLESLKWPSHAPQHIRRVFESYSKFTLTFWIFVTNYCSTGMCMIFQHRNSTNYFSPLILLNKEGAFHVQFHAKDGSGTAFTSQNIIPLNTWIYFHLEVDGARADMTVSFGKGQPLTEVVHISQLPLFFNATDGIISMGGLMGTSSFSGFLGHVQLYRNLEMKISEVVKNIDTVRDKLDELMLSNFLGHCKQLRPLVSRIILKLPVIKFCPCQLHWWDKKKQYPNRRKIKPDSKILSSYLLGKLENALTKSSNLNLYSLVEFSKILYQRTMINMEKQSLANTVAARLFELSGCLGYPKGYYVSAVMHKYGLGVKVNPIKTRQMYLLAAEKDYSLAQMALAYRHQLGIDGAPKDDSIVAAYLRHAAVKTKLIFEREDQETVTFSEMVRLDQVHLFRDVRGSNSQLVKWLTQQAKAGSLEAKNKVAEILYNGRQGAEVDRNQARQFYEMAADDNDVAAIFNLGVIHLKGINVPKNETKAFEFFKKAAEHNNSIAFNSMAFVELVHHKNRSGAIYFWKKAADLDDGDGLNNYAQTLEAGIIEGGPQNHTEALKYYLKASSKGQKNGCIKVGDYMILGEYTERQVTKAIEFYRFVADQINDVGICLKEAINSYADGEWYMSLVHHLLVTEAGLQLGGYNTALLLGEYQAHLENVIDISDPYYFYNLTAEQGWSLSMLEMGHLNWYNGSSRNNFIKASQYYARSIERDNNPEALFNLGYIVEHGYPMHPGIHVNQVKGIASISKNLTMASQLYQSCVTSESENKEGYYPCQIALIRIQLKIQLQQHPNVIYYPVAFFPIVVASAITYLKLR